jgi:hypothetical protein
MSELADNSGLVGNLANINAAQVGPNAITQQANTAANTQNTNANTQVQQQQAIAAAMQNQITKARQPLILARLHDMTTGQDDQSGVGGSDSPPANGGGQGGEPKALTDARDNSGTPDDSILDPGAIDKALRDKYYVPPVPPGALKALNNAYMVDPTDANGLGPKSVQARIDMWKAQRVAQVQQDSRNDFDALSAVTNAPEGQAMNVLEASHPEVVAALKKQFAADPDEDRDEEDQARLFAAHAAGAVHQYTDRKAVKDDAGVYRDEATGIPIPGVEQVGLSKEQYLKLAHEAITPSVDMPDGNGGSIKVAPWKAAQMGGAKNINGPGDWMMVQAQMQKLPGASGGAAQNPNGAHVQAARETAQSALDTAQKNHAAAPDTNPSGTPKSVGGVGTVRNAQGNMDPKLTEALHDTDFDYKPTNNGTPWKGGIGVTPPPAVLDDMKNQTNARNDLAKTSGQGVGAASAALTMYKAAQDVLAKGNYDGGAWNQELAKYSKWLPAGWQSHMTGDYQEIAKYLGNAALQSGKGIFSKMTEKESDTVMHDLNPSPGMTPNALRDMISRGAKTAQYSLDAAQRVPAYLHSSKDANQFATWNQRHYPMETETQPTTAKPNAGVAPAPKYTDAQVRMYMQKHGLQDEQATRKALGM